MPRYPKDSAVADTNRAIQFIKAHASEFKISAGRVGAMGFGSGAALQADAHRAIRYIRAHAREYGVSPDRVGVIGFSAGAELEGEAVFNSVGFPSKRIGTRTARTAPACRPAIPNWGSGRICSFAG